MKPPCGFISVIIPTYCRPDPLRRCIATLASQAYPRQSFEVIVVDDGGDPPAAGSLSGDLLLAVPIVLLRQPNRGAAAARATGLGRARGLILAFLDDDCTVPPDYLTAIDRMFRNHPETQIAQVGIDNPEPDNVYGRTWKFTLEETLKANLQPTSTGRLTCRTLGGVMVARREIFRQVAFDPMLSRSREDADICYQLQASNLPIYYEPQIRVFHHQRVTLWAYLSQFVGYGRGEFHLRRKWAATPAPYRYVTLTSWQALRSLLRKEGASRGLAIYSVLWLRRHASLCGLVYERAASEFPRHLVLRWMRFSWLLVTAYAATFFQAVSALTREPAMVSLRKRSKRSVVGVQDDGEERRPHSRTARWHLSSSNQGFTQVPRCSVIVAVYNEEQHIARLLASLREQTYPPIEVIVADDGSQDRTAEIAEAEGAIVLRLRHHGPAVARNTGARAATGEVLVFLDGDMACSPEYIERLVAPIAAGRAVGTFTRDIYIANTDNRWARAYAAVRGSPPDRLLPPDGPDRSKIFRAIRRDHFLGVGGYDDVGYGEDITIAPKLGELALVAPGAVCFHYHPSSLQEIFENGRWIGRGPLARALRRPWWSNSPLPIVVSALKQIAEGRTPWVLPARLVYHAGVLLGLAEASLFPQRHWK